MICSFINCSDEGFPVPISCSYLHLCNKHKKLIANSRDLLRNWQKMMDSAEVFRDRKKFGVGVQEIPKKMTA